MSITLNTNRIGSFTSSEIHKLMSNDRSGKGIGAPGLTYIKEKKMELKLKRSIDVEASSRPMLWGKFLEQRVHDMLDPGYELISNVTLKHPKIKHWSGSPDNVKRREFVACDTKCLQPKKFCEVVEDLTSAYAKKDVSIFRENHPDKYWQLVSNAILLSENGTPIKFIEPIIYMPYEKDLHAIRTSVENADLEEPWKYRFISECLKEELAYLPDDSGYKDLNVFRFALDQGDVSLLTARVIMAQTLLLAK